MGNSPDSRDLDSREIEQYLLGGLPEERRLEVQRRLFSDPSYYDQICDLEADLLDAYVRNELDPATSARLAPILESSDAQDRLRLARVLAAAWRPPEVLRFERPAPSFFSRMLAGAARLFAGQTTRLVMAATCGLLVGGVLFYPRTTTIPPANNRVALPPAPASANNAIFATFLPAGVTRGGSERLVNVPQSAELVTLQIELPETAPAWNAELRTVSGTRVWSQTGPPSQTSGGAPIFPMTVLSSLLQPGSYEVELSAEEPGGFRPVGYYYFRIPRP